MKKIIELIGWIAVLGMLMFCLFVCWDYVTVRLGEQERRILALEQSARPLFIVDKYSSVEVMGQAVYPVPVPDKTPTLVETLVAENDKL